MFLFKYHLTLHATTSQAPAELLLQRHPWSRLDLLFPDIWSTVERKQLSQNQTHDHHCWVRSFSHKDPVFVGNFWPGQNRWIQAKIIQLRGPVSARVQLANGEFQCRHFDHIRLCYKEEEEEDEQSYFLHDWADGRFDSYSPLEAPQKKRMAPVATSRSKPMRRSSHARNPPAWFDPSSYILDDCLTKWHHWFMLYTWLVIASYLIEGRCNWWLVWRGDVIDYCCIDCDFHWYVREVWPDKKGSLVSCVCACYFLMFICIYPHRTLVAVKELDCELVRL